ncbi:hypothetical protein [Bradyrhizobium sp. SZCCHNR3058]|uniref:hypothetical protein n=1 Tax=Bradyrhizobium sp. SZCCHNR3058 TaxID=3057423 RepID=UPI002916C7A3|nr:hypothetical protein [Bradyrhizobium sp. SZCCHNR3058]
MTQKTGYAELSKLPVPDETMPLRDPQRVEYGTSAAPHSIERQTILKIMECLARESGQELSQ